MEDQNQKKLLLPARSGCPKKQQPNSYIFILLVIFLSSLFFATGPVWAEDPGSPASGTPQVSCDLTTLDPPVTEKSIFLPECVYFEGTTPELEKNCGCRNVNVLVDFLVIYANSFFFILGGGVLLFFVYGGFVILTAAGGERVKKGRDIIVAATIGLIIIFTAQIGLKFILKAILTPAPGEKPTSQPFQLEPGTGQIIEPGKK